MTISGNKINIIAVIYLVVYIIHIDFLKFMSFITKLAINFITTKHLYLIHFLLVQSQFYTSQYLLA